MSDTEPSPETNIYNCPRCGTGLYTQLFDPRGARLFCPHCGYEEFLPLKFELHRS